MSRPHQRPESRATRSALLALADPAMVGSLAKATQRVGLFSVLAFDLSQLRERLTDRSLDVAVVVLDARLTGDVDDLVGVIRGHSGASVLTLHPGSRFTPASPDALRLDTPADTVAGRALELARRYRGHRADEVLSWGELRIVPATRAAYVGRTPLPLTPSQFAAMRILVEAGGAVVGIDQIATAMYGTGHPLDSPRVRAHIVRLRRVLRASRPQLANLLVTVRSEGYRLLPPDG